MAEDKAKGLTEQIEALEGRPSVLSCVGCGSEMDPMGASVPTQLINGSIVRGRAYCPLCREMGAIKENWQPQVGGRVSKMFVVKS